MANNNRYPEIEKLSLRDARSALVMGRNCLDSLTPEARIETEDRLKAIESRIEILVKRNRNRIRRERDDAMRSLGLVKTPYGWE